MTLHKLEALIKAAEKATARPWNEFHSAKPEVVTPRMPVAIATCFWPKDMTYIVAAANAAEDMARLLTMAHEHLRDLAEDHDHDAYCYTTPVACPSRIVSDIEQRFGGDDG